MLGIEFYENRSSSATLIEWTLVFYINIKKNRILIFWVKIVNINERKQGCEIGNLNQVLQSFFTRK